jgi:hypothetical protein
MKKHMPLIVLSVFSAAVLLEGCYYAVPAPVAVAPPPSNSYDLAWSSALRAAEEVGIQIVSVNDGAGIIYGKRGTTDLRAVLIRQHDGRTRVELEMKGRNEQTQALANDFFRAYDRYMARSSP